MNCRAEEQKAARKQYDRERYAAKKAAYELLHGPKDGRNGYTVHHRMSGTTTYGTWVALRGRCENPKDKSYCHYGARGISVCAEWQNFEVFLADMGEKPAGYSIDRIDNDRGYSKENCRWATPLEQNRNRRNSLVMTSDGEAKPLIELCRANHANYSTVHSRVFKYGWPIELALTLPKQARRADAQL